MESIIINEKLKLFGPSCWPEVNCRQFQLYATEWDRENLLHLFSLWYNLPLEKVVNSTDRNLVTAVSTVLRFVSKPFDFKKLQVPDKITLLGKELTIPKELNKLSIGQAIILRKRMDEENQNGLIAFACAVYLQPIYFNCGLEEDRVKLLENEINNLPIIEYYALGFFFAEEVERLWESLSESLQVDKSLQDNKDDKINQIAGAEELNDFADLNIIEMYCTKFPKIGPDECLSLSWDTVTVWIIKWHKEAQYNKRKQQLIKTL